jgi:hypothetical protein
MTKKNNVSKINRKLEELASETRKLEKDCLNGNWSVEKNKRMDYITKEIYKIYNQLEEELKWE